MNNKSLQLFAWVDSRYYREIRSLAADKTNMNIWDKINKITWNPLRGSISLFHSEVKVNSK